MISDLQLSDRDLLLMLEQVPENFVIGRDDFGWWYSLTGGHSKYVGFKTATKALFHYAELSGEVALDSELRGKL